MTAREENALNAALREAGPTRVVCAAGRWPRGPIVVAWGATVAEARAAALAKLRAREA